MKLFIYSQVQQPKARRPIDVNYSHVRYRIFQKQSNLYRLRCPSVRSSVSPYIRMKVSSLSNYRSTEHLLKYKLIVFYENIHMYFSAFRIRIHCIWPDPDPLQSPLRIQIRIRIHFDFFPRIRVHLRKH